MALCAMRGKVVGGRVSRAAQPRRGMARQAVAESAEAAPGPKKERKPSPLEKGGTKSGESALGKDPSGATRMKNSRGPKDLVQEGTVEFQDERWTGATWDLAQFSDGEGGTDWDGVIDAEIARRKFLEQNPAGSTFSQAVTFDTGVIPWWVWVRRFHLPEAEKLNGRAAMVGYFLALVIDGVGGPGLWDQQDSFLGKVALHVAVFGILLIRSTKDFGKYKGLLEEATFYDEQWNASWKGVDRPDISDEE